MNVKTIVCDIDIGGTNTVIGFIKRNGELIKEISIPTNPRFTPNEYFINLSKLIQKTLTDLSSNYELVGIGIGALNTNYKKCTYDKLRFAYILTKFFFSK